ncbi:nicotinate-nucleotide adenylyltransferase [Candidatus Synechococcus spongiarum]|uniref:nicotinate-nucleotide adenylyltransferase n=1 Tax=Candidatus Synechococcus spongiarum LMB bulk15N TaxID=1943583 RepID=A0A1T1D281_9SYNE|nr:nicotinate-nucleotide adenylyltransferase [Candidatus Synechococcus spongiarum]OOV34848.1 nicotinic acid mononucleotide adenylyltransferase [Candidatus Synechococcus spongiarum LMB bulk15N]
MSTQSPPSTMALFGTSADPPTIGHQAILAGLAQRYPMVATWASDNPLKHHGAPLAVRCQLLQAVVDGLKTRIPQGRRLELWQDFSSSRALESVQAARACFPSARLLFVVGVDLLPQILNWYQAAELLRCCCLAVVPRNNWPGQEQAMAQLRAAGIRLEALPLRIPSVASSQVRQRPDPALVPKDVLPVLASRGLYGFTAHDVRAHAARQ